MNRSHVQRIEKLQRWQDGERNADAEALLWVALSDRVGGSRVNAVLDRAGLDLWGDEPATCAVIARAVDTLAARGAALAPDLQAVAESAANTWTLVTLRRTGQARYLEEDEAARRLRPAYERIHAWLLAGDPRIDQALVDAATLAGSVGAVRGSAGGQRRGSAR